MPNIVIRYSDRTTGTLTGTSVSLVTQSGGTYQHNSKTVAEIEFDLGSTANTATVNVSPASGSMPAQSCYSGASPTNTLPFTAEWTMSSSTQGALVLTIPSASSSVYQARLLIDGGGSVEIYVQH